jgi:hypothetical protein
MFMIWWTNLLSNICIMKAPSPLLSAFAKKIVWLCQQHECGLLNINCAYPFAIHIHDRIGKFTFQNDQANLAGSTSTRGGGDPAPGHVTNKIAGITAIKMG